MENSKFKKGDVVTLLDNFDGSEPEKYRKYIGRTDLIVRKVNKTKYGIKLKVDGLDERLSVRACEIKHSNKYETIISKNYKI